MRKFNNANEEAEHILKILGKEPEFVDAELKNNIAHYVFYNKKHNFGVCSKCGSWFTLDQMIEATNDEYSMFGNKVPKIERGAGAFFCPECYEQLQAIPYGHGRGARSYGCRANYWVKKGKTLYLIVKLVEVDFSKDIVTFQKVPRSIYIYGKDGPRRLWNSWGSWIEYKSFAYKHENGAGPGVSRYAYDILCNTPDELLKGTYLDYAYDPDGYLEDYKETTAGWAGTDFHPPWIDCEYLALFQKMPATEVLHKTGFDYLIRDRLMGAHNQNPLNWSATRLSKIFRGLNKKEIREIRALGCRCTAIRTFQQLKRKELNVSVKGTMLAVGSSLVADALKGFSQTVGEQNLEKAVNYLGQQNTDGSIYSDYLRECEELGLDLNDKKIRYPKDLRLAHQRTTTQVAKQREKYKAAEAEERAWLFEKQIEKNFPRDYEWHRNGLLIRPALSPDELVKEGNAMHHCVGRYDEKVATGSSFIIFIRKEEAPEESFVTMECSPKFDLIQIRARANRDPDPEVRSTAEEWLAEYRKEQKKLTKKNEKETA